MSSWTLDQHSGWGRYPVASSLAQRPATRRDLGRAVTDPQLPHLLGRGAGRAYGDAALAAAGGGLVVATALNRMLAFDPDSGLLRCEAGVTLASIVETFVPRGWFLPVTPGTRQVSLGGSVACDVHGKNHHRDGSLGRHVTSLRLMTAEGRQVTCSPHHDPDLFRATVGGLGLTGLIVEVELQLIPVSSAYIDNLTLPARDLGHLLELFDQHDTEFRYSVAWIDCLAGGSATGRSILLLGNHADATALPPRSRPLELRGAGPPLTIPCDVPPWLLNRWSVATFNAAYYRAQARKAGRSLAPLLHYFYPLDVLDSWNRLYGAPGFVQYQMLVPAGGRPVIAKVLRACRASGRVSFLAVLKKLGAGRGWLSFPGEGYTLALDLQVRPDVFPLLQSFDDWVGSAGGRVYLVKDARLSPKAFRGMYPDWKDWRAVKTRIDPGGRFRSALSDRIGLTP